MKIIGSIFLVLVSVPGYGVAEEPLALVEAVATQSGVSQDAAKSQIELVFQAVAEELRAGRSVTIRRFGKFYVQDRQPRKARNPRTGESINVPAKRYPRFTSSEVLKEKLNKS